MPNEIKRVSVYNAEPVWFTTHTTIIPPNTSNYDELFNKALIFPDLDKHWNVIKDINVVVPITGMRNITVSETVIIAGVPTVILPGLYLIPDLISTFSVTIPTSGAGSYTATTTVSLDLTNAPQTANILGFPQSLIPASSTTVIPISLMNGFESLLVGSNLTYQSNDAGEVYLSLFHLTDSLGNKNIEGTQLVFIPVIVKNINPITWRLRRAIDRQPWTCASPITIQINIYSYLK